jgi:hypothetical protein
MSTEITYTHKGTKITFDSERAVFRAERDGRTMRAPSLDAIKKQIEEATKFDAFDAYIEGSGYTFKRLVEEHPERVAAHAKVGGYDRYLVKLRIVGFDRKEKQFRDEDGQTHHAIIRAVTGAVEAWVAHEDVRRQKLEREAQLQAEVNDAHKKIPFFRASEYGMEVTKAD